jgi:hypothetical protein
MAPAPDDLRLAARAGDAEMRSYFRVLDDRTLPDEYGQALPQICSPSCAGILPARCSACTT